MKVSTASFQHRAFVRTSHFEVALFLLLATASSFGQITNVTNDQATPTPGVGHDYIGSLNDIVNPSNGSLSIRIPIPTPPGRGLNLPIQFSYNSAGISQVLSSGTIAVLKSNLDSRFLEQGGWGYGLPLLSADTVTYPAGKYNVSNPLAVCQIITGFVFTDPAGSRHAMHLGLPNDTECALAMPDVPYGDFYTSFDGSYFAWTTPGPDHPYADYNSTFGMSDLAGTYYHFPYLLYLPGCNDYCNVPDFMEDRNGNVTKITTTPGSNPFPLTITDTVGRQLLSISSFVSSAGDMINVSGTMPVPGVAASYVVTWESVPYSMTIPITLSSDNNSSCSKAAYNSTSGEMQVVKSIQLPNGQSYQFEYDATYGLLNKITYPSGAYVAYVWGLSQQPSDAIGYEQTDSPPFSNNTCFGTYQAPAILQRTVSFDGQTIAQTQTFTYSTAFANDLDWGNKTTTVVTTDNLRTGTPSFKTIYTYKPNAVSSTTDVFPSSDGQIPVEHTTSYYDFSGSLIRTVTKSWDLSDNPALLEEDTSLPNGQTAKTVYSYDSYIGVPENGNIIEKDEYDYGQSSPTRTTIIHHQSLPAGRTAYSFTSPPLILNEPCQTIVYAGSASGTRVAETDDEYDGETAVCGTPGSPSVTSVSSLPSGTHNESAFGPTGTASRGNITTIVKWGSAGASLETAYTYDETGQILRKTDPCGNASCPDMPSGAGHITAYSYADNYATGTPSGNTNTYLTKITEPTEATTKYSYNYANGLLASSTDENSQSTNYTYADPFNRLTEVQGPPNPTSRPTTTYLFNDSSALTTPYNPTVTATIVLNSSENEVQESVEDPMGHVIQTSLTSDPNGADTVNTTYDGEGLVYTKTNPFRGSSPSANSTTTYYYDALGRRIQATEQDASALQWCYDGVPSTPAVATGVCSSHLGSVSSGTWVDSTDEKGNHWQRTSDIFGSLTEVMEPNGSVQSPSMETDYAYDALNNLLSVTQWGGASGSSGAVGRSFVYDNLSRLISATNPETGAVGYTYDANGNVQTKTDARGVVTNFSYDALNRLLGKTYSDSVTPSSCYQYDSPISAASDSNAMGRLTLEWTQSGQCPSSTTSQSSIPTGAWTSTAILQHDVLGRVLSEQQCTPVNCSTARQYPMSYGYDLAGNVTSYTNGMASGTSAISVTQSFDSANRLSAITSNLGPLFAAQSYTPHGAWNSAVYGAVTGNGLTLIRTYDSRLRITGESDSGQLVTSPTSGTASFTITGQEQSH